MKCRWFPLVALPPPIQKRQSLCPTFPPTGCLQQLASNAGCYFKGKPKKRYFKGTIFENFISAK